jgi:hypothetical protein
MTSHGISTLDNVKARTISPNLKGDFPNTENYTKLKAPTKKAMDSIFPSEYRKKQTLHSGGFINLTTPFGITSEIEYKQEKLSTLKTQPISNQLDNLKSPGSFIREGVLEMDGKRYRINRNPDKTKPGTIVQIKP